MKQIAAKYIRTEKFSNKNFFIEIKLYEHGFAWGYTWWKKRGIRKKMPSMCDTTLVFEYCVGLCCEEYLQFLGCFNGDKVARRWVRRVMKHCVGDFLKPDGRIDLKKAWETEKKSPLNFYVPLG